MKGRVRQEELIYSFRLVAEKWQFSLFRHGTVSFLWLGKILIGKG